MTTQTQPTAKHTQGEWRQVGNYILSENNEEIVKIITSDLTDENTAEANAQRIVKAVNSFEAMIQALREGYKIAVAEAQRLENQGAKFQAESMWHKVEFIESTLKQASQK